MGSDIAPDTLASMMPESNGTEGTVPARSGLTDGFAEVRRLLRDTGKHHQQMTGGTTPPWIEEERATLKFRIQDCGTKHSGRDKCDAQFWSGYAWAIWHQ